MVCSLIGIKAFLERRIIYINAIHILSTGYMCVNLVTSSQLSGMITNVKKAIVKPNPEYDLVIRILHLCY